VRITLMPGRWGGWWWFCASLGEQTLCGVDNHPTEREAVAEAFAKVNAEARAL
jgi:hypothetical protein